MKNTPERSADEVLKANKRQYEQHVSAIMMRDDCSKADAQVKAYVETAKGYQDLIAKLKGTLV